MPKLLISLHVPKSGGTSFRKWLDNTYGRRLFFFRRNRIFLDYNSRPIETLSKIGAAGANEAPIAPSPHIPEGIDVIHGHFPAKKYAGVPNAFRLTFLRHPISRAISHYYYWRHVDAHGNPSHDRFVRERPDIVAFAQWPEISGIYSGIFFRDTDMTSFDFIGNHSSFDSDFRALAKSLGESGRLPKVNVTRYESYRRDRDAILGNAATMAALEDALAKDIAFYENALKGRINGFKAG